MPLLPQPPEDTEVTEIPMFFRIGPVMLVMASFCIVSTVLLLAEALRWSDFRGGLMGGVFMIFIFGIPLFVMLGVVQLILGSIFMSNGRRAWWRTLVVLLPAILIIVAALVSIVNLYPPERRARNELDHFLGGPVPASISSIKLTYSGGIDPTRDFEFNLIPKDYDQISGYRYYRNRGGSPSSASALVAEGRGGLYYLDYDPAHARCTFSIHHY
jgi:MFS family permease